MKTIIIVAMLAVWSISVQGNEPLQLNSKVKSKQLEKYDFAVGDIARFGKVEVKINYIKRPYISKSSSPSQGMEQILVNMTLNNTGKTGVCLYQALLPINYGAEDLSFNKYVEEINGEGGSGASDDCLKPSKSIERDVVYEIPTGARGLKLQYETNQIISADPDNGTVEHKKTIYTLAF